MPLLKGKSNSVIGENISELHKGKTFMKTKRKFGKKKAHNQSIAIAMNNAGMSKNKKAKVVSKNKTIRKISGY